MNVLSASGFVIEAVPPGGWDSPLFSLESLYRAWCRCRRGKRRSPQTLAFEADCEAHLLALRDELVRGTYQPQPPRAFLLERPKRREVFAAAFRDRVVHHLLVAHLEPGWERRFIHDSWACRAGKGTHAAVARLQQFCRQATANGTRAAWYLQLDIKGFFIHLNRSILWARLARHEREPAVRWLIQTLLQHDPTQNVQLRGSRAAFAALPPHKTLFHAPPDCGLPIGNLTSQFFANVYLDALDQFIKHQLKVRWYLRYCDDLVLVSPDRAQLAAWEPQIAAFLAEPLHLTLNDRRRLQPVGNGIDFLGYIVRPRYLLVRRRVVGALRERLRHAERVLCRVPDRYPWPPERLERLDRQLQAYWAHLERAQSYRLRSALWRRHAWLAEYFTNPPGRPVRRVPSRLRVLRYREQIARLRAALPDYELRVQRGRCWERFAPRRPASSDSPPPRAWIVETGNRYGTLRERRVAWTERRPASS